MYEAFFNFKHTPFQRDIPPDALYVTPPLRALQDRLAHGVKNRYFLVVTGDAGSGKTTAIRQFISGLDPARTVALYVSEANLTPRNFYFAVLNQLGVKPHFYRGDAKRQLMKEILLISADKKLPVIIRPVPEPRFSRRGELCSPVNFMCFDGRTQFAPTGSGTGLLLMRRTCAT